MSQLSIENVINVSVSAPGAGAGEYNTSNLCLFTSEHGFGDFYKIYLGPADVATDFGSDSETYKMALAVFSQQPNILANNGYLVIIPLTVENQQVHFSIAPAAGAFVLSYGAVPAASISWDDTATIIQGKLRAIPGLEKVEVDGSISGQTLTVRFYGVEGNLSDLTFSSNTLVNGMDAVVITITESLAGQTLADAITASVGLVQFFGIMCNNILSQAEMLAAAEVVQALNKIAFFVQDLEAAVAPGGSLDLLRSGSFTHSRGIFYSSDDLDGNSDPILVQAAYAGRALSTNFDGSNTTQTMHLKDLSGIQPDFLMDQTLLDKCITAGADTYVSIQGVSKVFCSGANEFFDNVYNLLWFVGALEVAGFNVLAQTSTKIAQTENGLNSLASAYRQVCEQAVTNQFLAPGRWTSPNTFGNQSDLYSNISQRGYYIYSQPLAQQSPTDREAREAPLIQIAAKYAGAMHSSDVVVNINK